MASLIVLCLNKAIIGGLTWMPVARLVRSNVFVLREVEFVAAARALGVPRRRIIVRHILPNTLGPIVVAATLAVGAAIITESSLSFLGLDFPPDTPTWGRMLFDAQNYVEFTPSMAIPIPHDARDRHRVGAGLEGCRLYWPGLRAAALA